jgi:fumarate reductase subunit D
LGWPSTAKRSLKAFCAGPISLVKFAEGGLVFLLTVHLLGGLRVLVIENLDWRDGQKQLATLAAALSAIVAFIFLARVF